jgi:hypothetical protein
VKVAGSESGVRSGIVNSYLPRRSPSTPRKISTNFCPPRFLGALGVLGGETLLFSPSLQAAARVGQGILRPNRSAGSRNLAVESESARQQVRTSGGSRPTARTWKQATGQDVGPWVVFRRTRRKEKTCRKRSEFHEQPYETCDPDWEVNSATSSSRAE